MRKTLFTLIQSAAAAILLLLLHGCNDCDSRVVSEPIQASHEAPPEKSPQPQRPPVPLTIAPLRYEVPALAQNHTPESVLAELSAIPPAPFIVKKQGGNFLIQGSGVSSQTAEAWFMEHGFSNIGSIWTRTATAAELATLSKSTLEQSNRAGERLHKIVDLLRQSTPGKIEFKDLTPQSGNVVYTGQLLDFALNDTAQPPLLYVEAGGSFVRGGRLIVRDGALYLSGHAKPILDAKVPPTASHLNLASDGALTAFTPTGEPTDLGRIPIVVVKRFKKNGDEFSADETATLDEFVQLNGKNLLLPGHVEVMKHSADWNDLRETARLRAALTALLQGLNAADTSPPAPASGIAVPLIVHAPLPKTVEHLKALGIAVEKNNDRTTIGADANPQSVIDALVKVISGLRARMDTHEENLRNALKTRDADGRLNAFRRKTIEIGPQGTLIEGTDNSPLPKTYKPGDPDAGADGFVVMPNVNKAVETAEFKSVIEEYKLLRTSLQRLAPSHIFPEPPTVP